MVATRKPEVPSVPTSNSQQTGSTNSYNKVATERNRRHSRLQHARITSVPWKSAKIPNEQRYHQVTNLPTRNTNENANKLSITTTQQVTIREEQRTNRTRPPKNLPNNTKITTTEMIPVAGYQTEPAKKQKDLLHEGHPFQSPGTTHVSIRGNK